MQPLKERPHLFPRKGGIIGGALLILLLASLTVWVSLMARNAAREYKYIGTPANVRDTITVSGTGKVTGVPDVATIDLGTQVEKKTVAAAQQENTRIMNAFSDVLAQKGVAKTDIQTTNYSIYPQYSYPPNGQRTLTGYQVAQNVEVKIRDLGTIGDILAAAGNAGLNQVSGINFTIDDPEQLKDQAREKAFADARNKAKVLADQLGVKIKRVTGFSESGTTPQPVPMYATADKALGMGGGVAPTIEPGSTDVVSNVNITYEIE